MRAYSRARACRCTGLAIAALVGGCASSARPAGSEGPQESRIVEFGPGIRLNYPAGQVEINGEVILREGAIELFAYALAPVPKQHESIVLVRASPERVYQALGLIGLAPGRTVRYFPDIKKVRPPSGDPVEVRVRYATGGEQVEVSACDWMREAKSGKPMSPRTWLFTGSERDEHGNFTANEDGTLVTVVDFPSSLLSLSDSHTSSDADLWLVANTEAIPPIGTRLTLILRAARAQASPDE